MIHVGSALERVYAALKINCSILGNNVPHLHAHIQPRYHGDPYPGGVVNPTPGQSVTLNDRDARDQILLIRAALGADAVCNAILSPNATSSSGPVGSAPDAPA